MPAVQMPYWTAAMVRELPDDGKRYECIDGELLVTPSPSTLHQSVAVQLIVRLMPYVRDLCSEFCALHAPLDVELDDGMIVQPDVLAFRLTPEIEQKRIHGRDLLLAVEVLSPGTASRDRGVKRAFYQRIGVGEYWIVHPASRLVERWARGATAPVWEDAVLTWQPEGAAHALVIDLPALFDAVPEQFRTP
jgi:Uma2 family endonuclease